MEDLKKIIKSNKIVLVDFYATWCVPCKALKKTLQEIEEERKDSVVVKYVDVEEDDEASAEFAIRSVPTLILFKDGEIAWRVSGNVSKEKIVEKISIPQD